MKNKCCNKTKNNICHKHNEISDVCNFPEAVEKAFLTNRKGHQRRIPKDAFYEYKNKILMLEKEFESCGNFDEILELFASAKIIGIGDLTIYDTALKVGINYRIYPDKIYLHAGTKKGALNAGLIKKHDRKKSLTLEEIPEKLKWLNQLEPYKIEDFLCIYKNEPSKENLALYMSYQ